MTEFVTVYDDEAQSCARRALPEVIAGTGVSVGLSVDSTSGAVQYTVANTVAASITNLTYIAAPTQGTVVSSDGTDAVIPLANISNAGLLGPLSGDVSDVLLGDGTFGSAPLPPIVTTTQAGLIPQLSGNVNHVFLGNGTYGPAPAHVKFAIADEGTSLGTSGTVTKIDFVGSGVAASRSGNTVTVNVTGGGGGGGIPTNLTYTASPTGGTVLSDTGNDASIPLADTSDAGLLGPLSGDITDVLLGDGTFGPSPSQEKIQFVDHGTNLGTAGTVDRFNVTGGGVTFVRSGDTVTLNVPSPTPVTNLTYTASPTNGIVVSSTGVDAIIPLANTVNAGLLGQLSGVENTYLNGQGDFVEIPDATTGTRGIVEIATFAEVASGYDQVVVKANHLRQEIDTIAPCSSVSATTASVTAMTVDPTTLRMTVCQNDGTPSTMGINGDQLRQILGITGNTVETLLPATYNEWGVYSGALQCEVPGEYVIFVRSGDPVDALSSYTHTTKVTSAIGDRISPLVSSNHVNVRYLLAGATNQHYTLNEKYNDVGIQGRFPPGATGYFQPHVVGNQHYAFGSSTANVTELEYTYTSSNQDIRAYYSIYKIAN